MTAPAWTRIVRKFASVLITARAAAMKKGFLLTPSDAAAPSASDANLLQPIVTDECPVCLDPLNHDESIILTCRHMLCMPCTRSLWELRRSTDRATVHLECPVCRTLVKVANGDLAAFCAAKPRQGSGESVQGNQCKGPDITQMIEQPVELLLGDQALFD